jgi:hypothetical protein
MQEGNLEMGIRGLVLCNDKEKTDEHQYER